MGTMHSQGSPIFPGNEPHIALFDLVQALFLFLDAFAGNLGFFLTSENARATLSSCTVTVLVCVQ